MIDIYKTRLMHLKKDWISLLFWIVFPIVAPLMILSFTQLVQEDAKVPIGIVLEENSTLALELYKAIKDTPLIRTYQLDENEAINKLNKHELDSVFIIRDGYEKNIRNNKRDRLIMSYQSNLSIAYVPVSEMIISYVQQDASRSKAAHVVKKLSEEYEDNINYTWDDIIVESKKIQIEQSLLHSTFAFNNNLEKQVDDSFNILNIWSLWAVFALLSTLLLFDWVIKERHSNISMRFAFMKVSLRKYLLKNIIVYTLFLSLIDILTISMFSKVLNEDITPLLIISVLSYRLMITMGAFTFSLLFTNTYVYYSSAFILTLFIAISSGAIIPIDGIIKRFPFVKTINPLDSFLSGGIFNVWGIIFMIWILIWFVRKENYNA